MDSEQYRPGKYRGGWAAVIGRGNNKRRIQIGAGSKQDAEAFCRRLNAKLEFERRGRGPITIDRILDLYIKDRRAQGTVNVAPGCSAAYFLTRAFVPFLTPATTG